MGLEKINTDIRIPFDEIALRSGDPVLLTRYMFELAKTLQGLLADIVTVANFSLDLNDGDAIYYALKNSSGDYPIGTWRRIQVGDNLEDQVQLTLGTWTTAQTRERPV